jgi:uncharacterized membrane protein YhhN
MSKRVALILFLIAAVLELLTQIFDLTSLHFISKPLVVIFLVVYYYSQSASSVSKSFFLALVLCWLGDVFLLFDQMNEIFFMAGLGSFLFAHLLLIVTYREVVSANDNFKGTQRIRLSFPVILAGSGLVAVLYPRLGDLKIPVMIYALVLTLMTLQSIFRLGRTTAKSFWLVFLGAISFMISDSLLAINKFFQPVSFSGVWVMSTYIAAIFLIVEGVIAHTEKVK